MKLPDKDASPRPCEDTPPGFRLHNRDSRTAGVRDQLEIRLSKGEQHAGHQPQDGNDDLQMPQEHLKLLVDHARVLASLVTTSTIQNSDAGVALPDS